MRKPTNEAQTTTTIMSLHVQFKVFGNTHLSFVLAPLCFLTDEVHSVLILHYSRGYHTIYHLRASSNTNQPVQSTILAKVVILLFAALS